MRKDREKAVLFYAIDVKIAEQSPIGSQTLECEEEMGDMRNLQRRM